MPALVDIESYARSPIGRAAASQHILFWYVDPGLRVTVAWGTLGPEDIRFLTAALESELGDDVQRHFSLVDVRALIGPETPEVVSHLVEFVAGHGERLREVIERSIILHDGGPAAALVAGYTRLAGTPYPVTVVTDTDDALRAVGAEGRPIFAELERMVSEAKTRGALAIRTGDWIAEHLSVARVSDCAKALGVSVRSLQRALGDAGTTFRQEVERARVQRAKDLLLATDAKVLAVAITVGYTKVQNLSDAFRRQLGVTPSEWRQANRD